MTELAQRADTRRALLARYLQGQARPTAPSGGTIAPCPHDGPPPLSYGQQQLWILGQLMRETPVYNECVTIHLPGPLDPAVLRRSLREIVRRHEAWRTSFPLHDGQPVQRINPVPDIDLPLADLRHLALAGRKGEALRLASADAVKPFDLANGPLLRGLLVRLEDEHHRLYLTLHHIIFDGVAIYQVFLPELRAIYEAFLAGQPSPLPPLALHYADYAHWQRLPEQLARQERHLAYWREELAGAPESLALPTDRPRPAVETFRGSMYPFALTKGLTDRLKALSRQEGVTLYMTLLAAFNTLLLRYSGQEDILIGTATAGRNRSEFERMMGFFLNTIVMRTDLRGNPTFRALLARVRETTIEATAHDEVPFEYLVRALHPGRGLSRNPLFQVLLTLEPPLPVLPCGWTLTQMDVKTGMSKFDLSLELDDRPEGLIGRFEYNTDLFDEATIARMVEHWRTLLAGIVANPGAHLADLPLLTPAERRQLLVEWNDTGDASPACGLHQLIEASAAATPDTIAVTCGDAHLTYRDLNARANQLARHLRARGVGPDALVGLCVERGLDWPVALLGILKAGGAYVPLDPAFPAERLAFMLRDAQAPLLLTQRQLAGTLPLGAADVLCLDGDWPVIARESPDNPGYPVDPEQLAYVIYTSGSTGQPKGVQIPHRAVVNFLRSMARRPGIASSDTLLAVTTLSFDIAALELFLPLTAGARVVLASRETASDGTALANLLATSGATAMQATPATWRMLLDADWPGDHRLRVLCGGEALPRDLANRLLGRVGELWNLYGPTETTIWSAATRVEPGDGPVPIGGPLANTQLYVLDRLLRPVPIGIHGELCIGGAGVARGYLGRAELTAARFVADPFAAEPGARLYRTGDQCRYRPDGTLEFLGRLDGQVKLRGFRIELGEIEAALCRHPAVRTAVAVTRDDGGDARLVAYLVPRDPAEQPASPRLRTFLRASLPAYMVPATFAWLPALPLTPNGKVDRRALPAPDTAAEPLAGDETDEPQDGAELQLTHIWEEVLGRHPIGATTDFFDLGGHSLSAVRLFARIEEAFGQRLPLATLFQAPTIRELAAILRQQGWEAPWSSLVPLHPHGTRPPFFCVHAVGGNVLNYRDLARHIAPDQPLYAFQARGLDGRQPLAATVEAMAAHYVEEMRALQPTGPYYLGGQCFGGMVALEMAQQLQACGERVALLVMFDNYAPGYTKLLTEAANLRRSAHWLRQRTRYHLAHLRQLQAQDLPRYLARRALTVVGRLRSRAWALAYRAYDRTGHVLPEALHNVREANLLAQRQYVPRLYHGRPVLFVVSERAEEEEGVMPDPQFGWGQLASGGIAIHQVPGGHETMWEEPHIAVLAERLQACLAEAAAANGA